MSFLSAIILGLAEGITEFLPVSSTGHLILVSRLLRLPASEFLSTFTVAIQLGAMFAVIAWYGPRVFLRKAVLARLAVAFVPTAVIGAVAYKLIKHFLLGNTTVVVWALALGGVAIIAFERWHVPRSGDADAVSRISFRQAFLVGVAQSAAVIPGVSRSAASIIGGMFSGIDRKTATEFSFLLAVPTIFAAAALDLARSPLPLGSDAASLAVGLLAAAISAYVVARWFIGFIRSGSLAPFGFYRIALSFAYGIFIR